MFRIGFITIDLQNLIKILLKSNFLNEKFFINTYERITMSTTIQQITAILSGLTPSQRLAVSRYVDLSNINIMTLSEDDAKALLTRLKAAVGLTSNPIKSGMDERQAKLDAQKAEKTTIWEEARKAYYTQLRVASSDGSVENKEKADDLYFAMKLAGEHMVDATKRANNSAIQGIIFNA